ncbi:D-alanine--D-alanine ligase [Paenibacillus solisilvae]|uniref:D-alanine--D-alanine ligase n=1 Tax=Paenibacillus solisilvae TaxID=2486751 RepID=A0ABW0VZ44_9BACL
MKYNLYLLYGGKSVEHEISLKTAFTVIQALDYSKFDVYPIYITREGIWCSQGKRTEAVGDLSELKLEPASPDETEASSLGLILSKLLSLKEEKVVMPLLHGTNGEDGTIQGLMELLNVPYVGNGVLSSAMALDKAVTKAIIAQAGIAQTGHLVASFTEWLEDKEAVLEDVEVKIGYPCYVKPASLGSSIGISRCENQDELRNGLEAAYRFDRKIVVEKEVRGREIQVAVKGNEYPRASMPGEFIQEKAFFDFDAKYMDGKLTMSIPAEIPASLTKRIQENAVIAYQALNCSGLARVDFFITPEGQLFLNEVNTLPGFTNFSMYPLMWERTDGTTYAELVEMLIDYAIMRHAEKQLVQYSM